MKFYGVDLAWKSTAPSAVALLELAGDDGHGRLAGVRGGLTTDAEILECIESTLEGPAIVGIDAPLIVPNREGSRTAEKEFMKVFAPFRLGVYPASRQLAGDPPRGETFVKRLEGLGPFTTNPYLAPRERVHRVLEVYPHATQVALFNLKSPLRYKTTSGRGLEGRRRDVRRVLEMIAQLADKTPAALAGEPALPELERDPARLDEPELRRLEGIADAVMCAYSAFFYWYWAGRCNHVFGSHEEGYIVSPVSGAIRGRLMEIETKTLPRSSKLAGAFDRDTTVAELKEIARRFVEERRWERYHSPKNLSTAVAVEAAELAELFLWQTEDQSRQADRETRRRAAEEVSDILMLCLQLADVLDFDLSRAFLEKMEANRRKYPANGECGAGNAE